MSDIDKIIFSLFSSCWVGDAVTKNIGTMRQQLHKNLLDQMKGYWSGSTAYHIMTEGGFLKDSKKGKCKELTTLGRIFIDNMEEK